MDTPDIPKPRKTALLPINDRQLAELAVFAAAHWPTESWLTLRYTTAAAFRTQALTYQAAVTSRQQAGSARPIHADELLDLDALIDENLYRVKNRLADKYNKKTALAHYPTVGIIKTNKTYTLERERTKRAAALLTLLEGLKTEKITDGEYGTNFWTPIATRYNELVTELTDANGTVSKAVSAKDTMRDQIETVLSSLGKALDANYPVKKEYKAQLRAWGFQRESY
ncbi:hypothetical protein [Hymenobacter chitinivorans]|uniref:Uncharacterized protein n=1 Tax=Hymenobacter chitinivorans DSM 11115 TaxID=1121954 RepID=A0A2M9B9D7_9BACT|nr:hypothetical protein [Hymenobacter chitinivorans]PJJ54546.1 hypothetical protein CLV45_2887 [Hymenobacter chitinivorans DSM 11115]